MRFIMLMTVAVLACAPEDESPPGSTSNVPQPGFEPPVITNPESPVSYPPALYEEGVEGSVILQLFVNEEGEIVPDSSRIAEGSGHYIQVNQPDLVIDAIREVVEASQPVPDREPA